MGRGPSKSKIELEQVVQLEAVIQAGLRPFLVVALALMEVRANWGNRARGYLDFDDYCREVFGRSAQQVGRSLGRAATAAELLRAGPVGRPEVRSLAEVVTTLARQARQANQARAGLVGDLLHDLLDGYKPGRFRGTGAVVRAAPTAPSARCPACGQVPAYYRFESGSWRCSGCAAEVRLEVTAVTKTSGQCPRCTVFFDQENPRVPRRPYCTYCGEELEQYFDSKAKVALMEAGDTA